MRFDVLKIFHSSLNYDFKLEHNIESEKDYPNVTNFISPVNIEGRLTKTDDVIKLKASGKVTAEFVCDRCLSPVNVELCFDVEQDFNRAGATEKEAEFIYDGELDIEPCVKEAIILATPMKVVCDEDCKGLCPVCGKRLSDGDCGCDTTYVDPRFAALGSLFKLDKEV